MKTNMQDERVNRLNSGAIMTHAAVCVYHLIYQCKQHSHHRLKLRLLAQALYGLNDQSIDRVRVERS